MLSFTCRNEIVQEVIKRDTSICKRQCFQRNRNQMQLNFLRHNCLPSEKSHSFDTVEFRAFSCGEDLQRNRKHFNNDIS